MQWPHLSSKLRTRACKPQASTNQGAKNSTSMIDSGLTTDGKLDGVKSMTSDAPSATARDARKSDDADERMDERRMVVQVEGGRITKAFGYVGGYSLFIKRPLDALN